MRRHRTEAIYLLYVQLYDGDDVSELILGHSYTSYWVNINGIKWGETRLERLIEMPRNNHRPLVGQRHYSHNERAHTMEFRDP